MLCDIMLDYGFVNTLLNVHGCSSLRCFFSPTRANGVRLVANANLIDAQGKLALTLFTYYEISLDDNVCMSLCTATTT